MKRNKILSKQILTAGNLLSSAFALSVYIFFTFLYPYHLHYQEQFQLFLFTPGYLYDHLGKPGGLSDYAGCFLTQFYFYPFIGSFFIAALLTLLQRIIWSVSLKLGARPAFVPLSFVPSILYWALLCDENYLPGGLIAFVAVVFFIRLYLSLNHAINRFIMAILAIPLIYWLAGGTFILFPLFIIGAESIQRRFKPVRLIPFLVILILLSAALPLLARQWVGQYPLLKFFTGVNFYRYPVMIPYPVALTGILILLIPFAARGLSLIKQFTPARMLAIQLAVLLPGMYFLISNSGDFSKEEVMEYDFHTRMRHWDQILEKADKNPPRSPLAVVCVNLALAKHDLLGERMFHYYQNGMGGLLPDFTRDFTIPCMTGEVYYHLGLVNTAQRLAFESMEALPDFQKSVRSVMRLAETNLINENYELAGKYLRLLQKTFYYRKWAGHTLNIMQSEDSIEKHPEWGKLRKLRVKTDFLFSESEKEMMLGTLFLQNRENRMAFEYLMACCLIKKDLQHFMEYFPVGEPLYTVKTPESYQEALVYLWGLNHADPTRNIPYPISDTVKDRVKKYAAVYTSQKEAEQILAKDFADTFWYYFHYRN
ncbi:MAG: DUF6057 family protein [Mangrovibacterium sp.]